MVTFIPVKKNRSIFSGIACSTVTAPSNAALAAAQILAQRDFFIWSKLRMYQTKLYIALNKEDKKSRQENQNIL
jgi:hypothetical protein